MSNTAKNPNGPFYGTGAASNERSHIPSSIPDLELPRSLSSAVPPQGLTLMTGPTGSGKSTTLMAVIDEEINREAFPAEVSSRALTDSELSEIEHLMAVVIVNVSIDRQTEFKSLIERANTFHKLEIMRYVSHYLSVNGRSNAASRVVSAMMSQGIDVQLLNKGNSDVIGTVAYAIYSMSSLEKTAAVLQFMLENPTKATAIAEFLEDREIHEADPVLALIEQMNNGSVSLSGGHL